MTVKTFRIYSNCSGSNQNQLLRVTSQAERRGIKHDKMEKVELLVQINEIWNEYVIFSILTRDLMAVSLLEGRVITYK